MLRIALLAFIGLSLLGQTPDAFAPVRFLTGAWIGEGSGDPGKGSGASTFTFELGGKIMVRHSFSDYPAAEGRPAIRHDDLMTIFPEGDKLKALYLDNEGHVIHYSATALAQGDGVVFTSDSGPGPTFRLTYRITSAGQVSIGFAIAPPGKPDTFQPYVEGVLKRK